MESRRTAYGWALKLDRGEEITAALHAFATARNVRGGAITGIGAVTDCELGYFRVGSKTYERRTFSGEYEIGSLTGNFSELEGEPFAHCHIMIAGDDFVAYTGHLFRATVTVTCEIHVVSDPGVIKRVRDPAAGFNPLQLEG